MPCFSSPRLAKSANHNAKNRVLIKVSLRIFDTPSIAIPVELGATWPPNFHIRLGIVCDLPALGLPFACAFALARSKGIKSNQDALSPPPHIKSISLNTWHRTVFLFPQLPKWLAPFKAEKDNDMDVYILLTAERRDLVEKINATHITGMPPRQFFMRCSLYLFTNCLI